MDSTNAPCSLFHVVVDTDETASKVLDVMLREKTGRVTFMPLNRLKPKNPPAPDSEDAEPLINKMRYDPKYEKAFQQVFGKTCVCKDLTVAAAYVKSHGINTITLDGDKVDRKGALTGGYHDVRRSRIEGIKSVKLWRSKFESDGAKSKEAKAGIMQVEQEITQVSGRITVLNGQQNQVKDTRERLSSEGTVLASRREKLKERITRVEGELQDFETELSSLDAKLQGYQQELGTPLVQGITPQEEQLIVALGKEVETRRKEMLELSKRKNEVRLLLQSSLNPI